MALPLTFPTAQRIVALAYEDAAITQEGNGPNSEQWARGYTRLQDLIIFWSTKSLKLWTQVDTPVTLIEDQQDYTFLPGGSVDMVKPMRILQGYVSILDSSNTKRPIYPVSRDEWMRLSNTELTGPISQFFVDKLYNQLKVSVWLIPDETEADNTMHLLVQKQCTTTTLLTETMEFPPETFLALRWMLADDLATGQPDSIVMRCQQKAEMYRNALENWDVEDTPTQFIPDARGGMYVGKFS